MITVDETSPDAREAPRPDSDHASARETSPDAAGAVHDDVSSEPLREELTASTVLALVARTVRGAPLPLAGVLVPSAALWTAVHWLAWDFEQRVGAGSDPFSNGASIALLVRMLLNIPAWLLFAAITSTTAAIVIEVARARDATLGQALLRGLSHGFVAQLRLIATTSFGLLFCAFPGLVVLMERYAVGAVAVARDMPRSIAWSESKRLTAHRRGLVFTLAIIPAATRLVGNNALLPMLEGLLWEQPLPDSVLVTLGNALYASFQVSTFVLDGLLAGAIGAAALGVGTELPRTAALVSTFE